ncbi:hypothetical protein [Ciceribacter ferrooxidans]|uniref:Uncharacterized protein n=1 Tax=Ciceribacter ferrooxidans TaxID=2509717 RepID=A0A4Q2SHN4_9HYPH|nr:hypothetical protein [Ciceribacter ferrooxidans]RYC04553.1 hypothetical protein EUU22_20535 [Ciceribacter ferrooxidans]
MDDELQIYRLVPLEELDGLNWQNAPSHGEVVVRGRSAGDARIVAMEGESDLPEVHAKPAEDVSAFRSDKLYSLVRDESGRYPAAGPHGVVAGQIRRDVILPKQI